MGVSPNFQSTPSRPTSEQDLLEDLIIESIGIVGTDVYYLPRGSLSTPDSLYGEDPVSVFDKAYRMPMYLNSFLGPSGPSEIFGKFGMAISDSHRYILARRTFQKWVPQDVRTRPMEGDLIYIPAFTDVVEVKFVEQEHKFYPLARRAPLFYYYELSVESFKFSNEKFRTGFAEIDGIFLNYSYTLVLSLSSTSNTNLNFSVGETVWQANTGFTANVKAWDATTQTLRSSTRPGSSRTPRQSRATPRTLTTSCHRSTTGTSPESSTRSPITRRPRTKPPLFLTLGLVIRLGSRYESNL